MLKVLSLKMIEERPFYDSWWLIETDLGRVKLHQHDDINPKHLEAKISRCNTLAEVLALTPKHFYCD